jgi:long-subunit fatty acid transport protein
MNELMRAFRVCVRAVLTALAIVAGSTAAFAQSNDEVFPQFQFNFSTPGARANAMGRTFIGIADDSSASITNPAGLVRLTRRQFYVEFKSTELEVERLAGVRSLVDITPSTFGDTTSSIGFLSLSAPVGDRLAVAFTRHEFLRHHESFTLDPRPIPNSDLTFFPVEGRTEFTGVSYAGSVAVTVSPIVRLGFTLSYDTLSAESEATRFDFVFPTPDPFSARTNPNLTANRTDIDENASGLSAIVGVLIVPNDRVTIGVQYAKGATFEVDETLRSNPDFDFGVNAPLEIPTTDEGVPLFPKTVTINVPDRIGFGVAVRPTPRLLAAVDIVRIGYSSLTDDFTLIFSESELDVDDFEVDDVTEFHAGAEYLVVPGDRRLFVRAGLFTSPDHSTRYLGTGNADGVVTQIAKYNLLPRETDVVGSFGVGIAVGPRFQADFAYVVGREFVASAAVRF